MLDALPEARGARGVALGEVGVHGQEIGAGLEAREIEEGLDLRGEGEVLRTSGPDQGVDTHAVAGQQELPAGVVPEGEGELAA